MVEDFQEYLSSSPEMDFEDGSVSDFYHSIHFSGNQKQDAIAIYLAVRDGFLYDPYHLDLRPEQLKASVIVSKKRAWCVEKALLAATLFRKHGFPARLGFGIVKNHIGVEKLLHYLRNERIVFHGFVEVFIENKWVKCTPAFDQRICKLSNVSPLEWNGEEDSLFQAYNLNGERSMEYLHFYGSFETIPFELMQSEMQKYYPHLFHKQPWERNFSFHFEEKYFLS